MYKVIEHNGQKALRQEPEMEEPTPEKFSIDKNDSAKSPYELALKYYQQHISDCSKNIIDIAPDSQGHWELGDLVKDSEFEKDIYTYGIGPDGFGVEYAIPLLEQEKEEGLSAWLNKIQPDFDTKESYQHGFHDAIKVVKDHITKKSKQ